MMRRTNQSVPAPMLVVFECVVRAWTGQFEFIHPLGRLHLSIEKSKPTQRDDAAGWLSLMQRCYLACPL